MNYSGDGFTRFLHSQSSVLFLELIQPCCRSSNRSLNSLVGNTSFLPSLSELAASICEIIDTSPNRPIHTVNILPGGRKGFGYFHELVNSLCNSLAPVTSIGFRLTYPPVNEYVLWRFVEELTKSKLALNLPSLDLDIRLAVSLAYLSPVIRVYLSSIFRLPNRPQILQAIGRGPPSNSLLSPRSSQFG